MMGIEESKEREEREEKEEREERISLLVKKKAG